MKYYDQLLPRQGEKTKGWHDSLAHHHPSELPHNRQSPDLTIPPLTLHFQHLLEDQFLHCLILEDQADLLLSSTTTQPRHLRTHHHQRHRQRRGRDHLFIDQQPVMCDTWQRACQIWNLQSRKRVMLRSCYSIIIRTTFSLQRNSRASSITFLCHSA